MRITNITKLTALAGLALLGSVANAATVSCPGTLTTDLTRQIVVTGAEAGGLCAYQTGNFNGDNFTSYFPSGYTLVDKDIPGDAGTVGGDEGGLRFTITPVNGKNSKGTWTLGSNLWTTYDKLFLAWHFGNGSGDPDGFIVQLERNVLTGNWELLPNNVANGLSNFYLIGTGRCTVNCGPPDQVPEPGSLALLGLGLLGLGLSRRRQAKD
jgi:hypothetical protein